MPRVRAPFAMGGVQSPDGLRVGDSPPKAAVLRDVTAARGWTPAALAARAATAGAPVWLDGDELSFLFRGEAVAVRLCCGIQQDMHRLAGSDTWALTVKHRALARAIVSYHFIPDAQPRVGETLTVWRGPRAPAAPAQATTLQGSVRVERLPSAALGEEREVTLYLPPGHTPAGRYPVIYAADGEVAGGLGHVIEPHILSGALPPLLIVGAHAGDNELRAREYLPARDAARFAAHARFFVEELAAWAERTLGATSARALRAVFGFSNGGVCAGELALRHPDHFGIAMPFSAGFMPDTAQYPPQPSVRAYLAAGLFEEGFYTTTRAFATELERAGASVAFSPRAAGHDYAMWEEEFAAATCWAFGAR